MSQPPRFDALDIHLSDPPFPDADLRRDLIAQNPARAWRRYCWLVYRHVWFGSADEARRAVSIRAFQQVTGRNSRRFDAAAGRILRDWVWRTSRYYPGNLGWNERDAAATDPFNPGWSKSLIFDAIAMFLTLTQERYHHFHHRRLRNLERWLWKFHVSTRRTKLQWSEYRHIRGVLAIALEEAQHQPPPEAPEQQNGANLAPYPDWDEWRLLVAAGREASREMLYKLELHKAKFGSLHTPFNLSESLRIGRQLLAEHFKGSEE